MKKLIPYLSPLIISGCYSLEPLKTPPQDELNTILNSLNGKYKSIDSRENKWSKYSTIDITLSSKSGRAIIAGEDGRKTKIQLRKCKIANHAQANNMGTPFESIEELITCDIESQYQYARIYIGKVKNNFTISDKKLIKTFDPMTISGGYLINIKLSPGGDVFLNSIKE